MVVLSRKNLSIDEGLMQEISVSMMDAQEVLCDAVKAKAEEVCYALAEFSDKCEWCVVPTHEAAHCFSEAHVLVPAKQKKFGIHWCPIAIGVQLTTCVLEIGTCGHTSMSSFTETYFVDCVLKQDWATFLPVDHSKVLSGVKKERNQ